MLQLDKQFMFALDVARRFEDRYPKVNGILLPYRPTACETEGITITIEEPVNGNVYRVSLCGRKTLDFDGYCVRVSQFKKRHKGYSCFSLIGKQDIVLNKQLSLDKNIQQLVEAIESLLRLVKFPLE